MSKVVVRGVNVTGLLKGAAAGSPKHLRLDAGVQVLDFLVELKRRMEDAQVSQRELARRIGATPTQVSRWLNTASGLNAKSLFLLAKGLGYDVEVTWIGRSDGAGA